jgi:hypothetical protein
MIKIITSIFIFCIVLFFYIHIQFHLKTSNDLEIFEIEQASKDTLDEICDLRQPVLFDIEDEHIPIIKQTNKQQLLEHYPMFEIKIRENVVNIDSEEELYLPLTLDLADKLFHKDSNNQYFSEKNEDFLKETGVIKVMQHNDLYLRPPLISNCNYDILMGSNGYTTPFRYDINYRNFYIVTQGSIQIKLAPPKSIKYLYPENDYENFEFRSPVNAWDPQEKYKNDFNKIKCLEINLVPGKCFFIPAYWYYSFKFEDNASVSCFHYRTYMNNIAIVPDIIMHILQTKNVKRKFAKKLKLDISTLFTSKSNVNVNDSIESILSKMDKDKDKDKDQLNDSELSMRQTM